MRYPCINVRRMSAGFQGRCTNVFERRLKHMLHTASWIQIRIPTGVKCTATNRLRLIRTRAQHISLLRACHTMCRDAIVPGPPPTRSPAKRASWDAWRSASSLTPLRWILVAFTDWVGGWRNQSVASSLEPKWRHADAPPPPEIVVNIASYRMTRLATA